MDEQFVYPPLLRWRVGGALIVAGLIAAFALYSLVWERPADENGLRWLIAVTIGALASVVALRWYWGTISSQIYCSDDGMAQVRGDRVVASIAWPDIARLRYHTVLSGLAVRGRDGQRIYVDRNLVEYERLVELTRRRTPWHIERAVF